MPLKKQKGTNSWIKVKYIVLNTLEKNIAKKTWLTFWISENNKIIRNHD